MDPVAPPKPAPDLNLALQPVQNPSEPGPAAKAAEQRLAEHAAALRNDLIPDKLLVRLDENAGRFVQTLTDAATDETVRKYPSDAQLAFSRAINAYMRSLYDSPDAGL